MDGWIDTDKRMAGYINDGWMDSCMGGCMNKYSRQMDRYRYQYMDEWIDIDTQMDAWMNVRYIDNE